MNEYLKTLYNKNKKLALIAGSFVGAVVVSTSGVVNQNPTNPSNPIKEVKSTEVVEKFSIPDKIEPEKLKKITLFLTPALSQLDNYTMPHRTCNSSSNTMFLNFYRLLMPKDRVTDDTYLGSVLKRGDTIYHEVQTETLKAYGLDTIWLNDKNLNRLKALTSKGLPSVVNILHRGSVNEGTLRGGHVIMVTNYDPIKKRFTISDPYGSLESDYTDHSTLVYTMPENIFTARWQGGMRVLTRTQSDNFEMSNQY